MRERAKSGKAPGTESEGGERLHGFLPLLAFPFKEASAETSAVGRALPLLPLPGKAFVIACGLV